MKTIEQRYRDLMNQKKELYIYSLLLKDASKTNNRNYQVTLDCYCNAVDDLFKILRKIHKVDWVGLSNRKQSYLKQLKYAFERERDRDVVLKRFKYIA